MSHCVEVTLLRLQSVWLGKLLGSGLLIPASCILLESGYEDSGKVISKLTILLAYVIIASGYLPVVILFIPMAALGETLLAVASWSNGTLRI